MRIFDTTTWAEIAVFTRGHLHGTASWGPDSDRFLMTASDARTGASPVWIQHLDGTRQEVTNVRLANSFRDAPVWAMGLADNDHLLTMRAPRGRVTLMRTSVATGEHEVLLTWPGRLDNKPVIAQMPPGTWNTGR